MNNTATVSILAFAFLAAVGIVLYLPRCPACQPVPPSLQRTIADPLAL